MTDQTNVDSSTVDVTGTPQDPEFLAWKASQEQAAATPPQSQEEPTYEGFITKVEVQGTVAKHYVHVPHVGRTLSYEVDCTDESA
ncbi:MAG: hypothetical protein C5B59_13710 [Bacteroidetes bacterium]|nr:MAG: hypothetical protein C5B59_13710 [Bacteroidota bacterium]